MTQKTPILLRCGIISIGLICHAGIVTAEDSTRPWSANASAGIEYSDNVGIEETDVSTGEGDEALAMDLSLGYKFQGMSNYEIEAGYDFFQSLYQDYSELNLQSHSFSLSGSRELNNLDLGLNYRYTYTRLDNSGFLQIHNLQPTLGFSIQPNWYLNLAYDLQDKDFFDNPGRNGDQHALSLDNYIVFNGSKSYVRLGYRIEDEDTNDAQYDYLGHIFNVALSTSVDLLSQEIKLDFSYQYSTKDYSSITPSIGRERNDHRNTYGIQAHSDLSDSLFTDLKYEYIDASSNLSSSDFNENIVTLSVGHKW